MLTRILIFTCFIGLWPIAGYAQSNTYALQRILQRYTEAYGGFRDEDALASLSVEGTIEQNGQTFDFLMRKKRPYSLRYRLSNESNSVIVGYNGTVGWQRVESHGEVTIEALDAAAVDALREQARFEGVLFRHLEKDENKIELISSMTLDGVNVYQIEVSEFGRVEISRYYLDAQTSHILRIDQLDAGGEVHLQTLYRDYRDVEGYPFAHEIENRIDGETVSLAKVQQVHVNPGLLSFYFEKPRR